VTREVPADATHKHPIFARFWTFISEREDEAGQAQHRQELLAGARGRAIELGAGNGRNFPHYPAEVGEVVAIEPEPYLRERAREAAADASVNVEVVDATDDPLPCDDGSFDVAVACLVLCSVPDQARALAELRRVLKPGGELRFYEHVVPRRPWQARLFRAADSSGVWPKLAAGCHCSRDTGAAIAGAGFEVESLRRLSFNGLPHILGVARAT
jgi:ubiquinone/menaquinone biosynthesis C-methylase UbiE